MGRILAIDYGLKRTGIAVTDPLRIVPGVLTTIPAKAVVPFLEKYLEYEEVDIIVVGKALQTDKAEESETMRYIRPFVEKLKSLFPAVHVELHDERYTSVLAQRAIRESGVSQKRRRDKALVDRVSAVIILQSYMSSLQYQSANTLLQN